MISCPCSGQPAVIQNPSSSPPMIPLPCALSSTGQVQPCSIASSLPGLGVVMVCLSFHRNLHLRLHGWVVRCCAWYFSFHRSCLAPVIREPLTAASRHRQRGRKEAPHVENQENPRPMLRRFFRTLTACPSFQLKVCELFPICYGPRQPRIPAVKIAPGDGVPVAGLFVVVARVYG